MTPPLRPDPPNLELELARLANDAMADGADPHDTTQKLHATLSYLRKFPKVAEQATNALADGVASPADITRQLWPHASALTHATGSNAPTAAEEANLPADGMGFGGKVATHLANVAQGFPGGELAQVGFRMIGRQQPYDEAYRDIHRATESIPTAAKIPERMLGAIPAASFLPASAAASGAIVGGADQLLNADLNLSLAERGLRTAAGAAGGALLGKATEGAVTLGRAALAKRPASLLLQKQAERAASAKGLYDAALAEGRSHEATPAIREFLADPQIADIVDGLKGTRQFANAAPESPEMLDAIYKTLSDQAKQAQRGLDALNPRSANQGRFRLSDIKAKQQQLLAAMEKPGVKPALTMDVAPETYSVEPQITPGREAMSGPISGGRITRDPLVSLDDRGGATEVMLRQQGPAGPAFQLRAQPDKVVPGVTIETPAMRVQTAPERSVPAMMPTYPHAVQDYAKRTAEIDAIQRGYNALRQSLSGNLPTAQNLTRTSPEAFAEWAAKATPQEVAAARQGILGATKMAAQKGLTANPLKLFGLPRTVNVAGSATDLLREARTQPQAYLQLLQNLGLLTAGNATSP